MTIVPVAHPSVPRRLPLPPLPFPCFISFFFLFYPPFVPLKGPNSNKTILRCLPVKCVNLNLPSEFLDQFPARVQPAFRSTVASGTDDTTTSSPVITPSIHHSTLPGPKVLKDVLLLQEEAPKPALEQCEHHPVSLSSPPARRSQPTAAYPGHQTVELRQVRLSTHFTAALPAYHFLVLWNYRGFPNGSPSTSSSVLANPNAPQRMASIQPPQPQQPPRGVSPVTATSQQQQQPRQPTYPWSQRKLNLNPPVTLPRPGVAPPQTPSPSPFPRYGHALPSTATSSGELFLFGGLVREQVRNDVYLISTRELSATMLQTTGEIPSPRVGHASALVGSVLIVWGGDTKTNNKSKPGDSHDDGLYLLNLCMSPQVLQVQLP